MSDETHYHKINHDHSENEEKKNQKLRKEANTNRMMDFSFFFFHTMFLTILSDILDLLRAGKAETIFFRILGQNGAILVIYGSNAPPAHLFILYF